MHASKTDSIQVMSTKNFLSNKQQSKNFISILERMENQGTDPVKQLYNLDLEEPSIAA